MEAKDQPPASSSPSSSSSPATAKDTPPDDDVGVALAKEAASHFQSKRFPECADVLSQILQRKPADPSVLHNVAVTEFLKDGSSNPKKLLETLNTFKVNPADVIILEGILAFHDPRVREIMNMKIFVDTVWSNMDT